MSDPPENVEAEIDDAYLLALGRFVHHFAETEGHVGLELGYLAGVDFSAGIALFSGVRTSQAMGLINRLLEATQRSEEKERLARAFAQLGQINAMRNALLHHGTERDTDAGLIVHKIGHIHARTEIRRVSEAMLNDMTHDLELISGHLLYTHLQHEPEFQAQKVEFLEEMRTPWRYKPPQPFAPGWSSLLPNPKPQDPPPSSEA